MESPQAIKSRLRTAQNIGQITKAMEVVAATKMRRAQEAALGSRPYAFVALGMLERLLRSTPPTMPLLEQRLVKKTAVVMLASDRGLAGSFNSQVFKMTERFLASDSYRNDPEHAYQLIVIGKKAASYARAHLSFPVREFTGLNDVTAPTEITPLAEFLTTNFLVGEFDRVIVISTHFRTALKQEPLIRELLPLSLPKVRQIIKEIVPEHGRFASLRPLETENNKTLAIDYLFEPSATIVLEQLLPRLLTMQLFHLFLEAKASEHSARRVAMKTASDNAAELGDDLTLEYNKARQVAITGEIMEITTTITTLE